MSKAYCKAQTVSEPDRVKLRKVKQSVRRKWRRIYEKAAGGDFYRRSAAFWKEIDRVPCKYCEAWERVAWCFYQGDTIDCSQCPMSAFTGPRCRILVAMVKKAKGSPKKQAAVCEWVLDANKKTRVGEVWEDGEGP